ncbi:hypothetical protein J6590_108334 [Homalodisca vitripennis]|nr:hypothetical protein J6590_108334 [Homalodisca vitripennis]
MVNFQNFVLESSYERNNMKMGGVAIYRNKQTILKTIRSNIGKNLSENKVFECCEIKIDSGIEKFLIAGIYRSPDSCINTFIGKLNQYLSKIKSTKTLNKIVIGGDYNINILQNDNNAVLLKNAFKSYGLKPKINSATRITENTATCIDNFFTNLVHTTSNIIEPLISDHQAIEITVNINHKDKLKNKKSKIRSLKHENLQELKLRLKTENWMDVLNEKDPHKKYQKNIKNLLTLFYITLTSHVRKKKLF